MLIRCGDLHAGHGLVFTLPKESELDCERASLVLYFSARSLIRMRVMRMKHKRQGAALSPVQNKIQVPRVKGRRLEPPQSRTSYSRCVTCPRKLLL